MSNNKLTEKQKQFCEEYIVDLNATQSAIRAGYSERTAHSIGNENLIKPEIQNYIQELKKKRAKELKITQLDVLKELYNWAFSDITQTIGLTPFEIEQLPDDVKRLITKYKKTTRRLGEEMTEETIELHFVSKEKAMEMIARHIGFYEKDNDQKKSQINLNQLDEKTLMQIWNARNED
ncbi:MAG: terminase small subunit [Tenacibaculum sp.]|nr:terminase small subunit [Tenacibaculum sp.]